jgi:hypothetical protein
VQPIQALVFHLREGLVSGLGFEKRDLFPKAANDGLFIALVFSQEKVGFLLTVHGCGILPSSIRHGNYPFQFGVRAGAEGRTSPRLAFVIILNHEEVN